MTQPARQLVSDVCDWSRLGWIALTDKRDAIRIYARLGLHPIVLHGTLDDGACTCGRRDCQAQGKHPVEHGWQRLPFELERTDRLLVDEWRRNVGLRMGLQPSGDFLVAIDVDGPRDLLVPLEAKYGTLPPTLTARTGGGGLHFVYRVPAERAPGNRVRLATGIDARAEGGQIVAAPSRHVSGRRYEWIDIREPADLSGARRG